MKPIISSRFIVLGLLLCLNAHAQEMGLAVPNPTVIVKLVGVVQYVDGRVVKTEPSGSQSDVVYQTPLYEGDRLESARGAVLKFATRSNCIVVLRGEGATSAPVDKKPWRFRGESTRVICPGKSSLDTVSVDDLPMSVKDGEVLILSQPSRAMALRGSVQIRNQTLELRKLYDVSEGAKEASPQPGEESLRTLNEIEKPPRESAAWPAPPKLPTVRLIFSPVGGGDAVFYDASDLNQRGLSATGPRLQVHLRKPNDTSLIFAFTYREPQDNSKSSSGGPQPEGVSNSLDELLLEVGRRSHHDRWWSTYYRFGVGRTKAKVSQVKTASGAAFSNYTGFNYDFAVLSATYGIDASYVPKFLSPFGFYAAAEAQIIQSIWRNQMAENQGGGYSTGFSQEPWRLTSANITLSLGIQLQF